ncbi:MAG: class I SAM-dependent methyltransferase [Roseibacillus sp.]
MTISDLAKELVAEVIVRGDRAVDATMGNGWDTLFLAEKVGEEGRVFAFDVQAAALVSTRKKLVKAELLERCEIFERGHEEMDEVVSAEVGAVMFNLGYLPYAEKEITTCRETTLQALDTAALLLRAGGILTVICYRGHPGGQEEAAGVLAWAAEQEGFVKDGPTELPEGVKPFLLSLKKKATE